MNQGNPHIGEEVISDTDQVRVNYKGEISLIDVPRSLQGDERNAFIVEEIGRFQDINDVPQWGDHKPKVGPNQPNTDTVDNFFKDLPRMIGAAGGAIAVARTQAVQQSGRLAGALKIGAGAGAGGAAAESGLVAYELATKDSHAPDNVEEATKRVAGAGVEQALWELSGQAAVKGLEVVTRPIRGKAGPLAKELQKQMGDEASLMVHQLSESRIAKTLGGWANLGFTGKDIIEDALLKQGRAIMHMADELSTQLANNATKLTGQERGQLVIDTIKGGNKAFKSAADVLYKRMDVLLNQRQIYNKVMVPSKEGIVDAKGAPMMIEKLIAETVDNAPVDMRPAKQFAQKRLDELLKEGSISGVERQRLLTVITGIKNRVLFSTANGSRSQLLALGRTLEGAEKGEIEFLAKKLGDIVTTSMESAAKATGDDALIQAYTKANRFYSSGKEIFANDFIKKLVKKAPEDVGKAIYADGKIQTVKQVKKALMRAAALDKNVNFHQQWQNVQAGYIERLLSRAGHKPLVPGSLVEGKVTRGTGLQKRFEGDEAMATMSAVLNTTQMKKLMEFKELVSASQYQGKVPFSMLFQFGQAGAGATVALGATGIFGGDSISAGQMAQAAAVLASPRLFAKFMTNPRNIDLLIKGSKTPANTTAGQQLLQKFVLETGKLITEAVVGTDQTEYEVSP